MIGKLADTYAEILIEIFRALLPIIIFMLFLTFIKIIIDYIKYGKKAFSVFDKRNKIDISKENLKMLIDNLNVYYKLVELNNNTIILILECGIYVFYSIDYNGIISGDINQEKLILGKNTQNEKKIDNPVYVLKNIINELNIKIGYDVFGYVLLKSNCIFSVLNRTNIKVMPKSAFYYHFSKLINNKKISIKEIDEIYEKII